MEHHDLPSDSDSSDEDFNPEGEPVECLSEADSESDCDAEEPSDSVGVKRKRSGPRKARKKKKDVEDSSAVPVQQSTENVEEKKKRAESLWADFLKDCDPVKKAPEKKAQEQTKEETPFSDLFKEEKPLTNSKDEEPPVHFKQSTEKENKESQETDKIVKSFSFAGEDIKVEQKPGKRVSGGLASVLGQLKNKSKLSTLEKSKLDWESFKSTEGISETIKSYNKGKNGYLERQDFLERADLRQFEIEKNLRASRRSNR